MEYTRSKLLWKRSYILNNYSIFNKPTKIAINAQIPQNSGNGGVESVLISLVSALGKLDDGLEEYVIIGPYDNPDWLQPFLGPNQILIRGEKTIESQERMGKKFLFRQYSRKLIKHFFNLFDLPQIDTQVPISNGFFESTGCDLIHFPDQLFTICALPSVYNPHDLQHLHFPQFFTPRVIRWRETIYQAGCHYANTVVVGSQWIKDDLIEKYGLNSKKIQVIPWGPPTQIISNPTDEFKSIVKKKYSLPDSFAFYPAMLWEHKNHVRLLDAMAYLRDNKNLRINLVCSGNIKTDFWGIINQHIQDLNLMSQVQFLGMVSYEELRALYQLSQFVVIPTLFEAASGPVFEAWFEQTPVACSSVTSLPEQASDAAFLINPISVESIANSMFLLQTEESVRNNLVVNGMKRLLDFNWNRTAKAYRAVYRKTVNKKLSEEDNKLLHWDWMRYPDKYNEENL